jgi:protease secretion system membrane fusion protein
MKVLESMHMKEKADVSGEHPGSLTKKSDTFSPIRLGLIVLIIGFGSFLLWAAFAPLDEGVPCSGAVSIATKSKVVQHLQGGVVQAVHVREGQMVREGDVLISLDNQTAKARYEDVHQHYIGIRAAESRLLAEQRGAAGITFHPDVVNDPNRQLVQRIMQSEQQLFYARQNIVRLLQQQLDGVKGLVSEGYAPLNQQRDLEIKLAEIRSNMQNEMAMIQREVQADAEKSQALAEELARTEIRAPASGQVVGIQVQTVGAVIQPGQKLMDIVPFDERLLVEIKIAPHLIDRIYAGLIADVRFTSFAHSPQLVVSGKIESISKDLLTDQRMSPGQPGSQYYLALVSITPEGLKILGDRQLQPGMPVQAVIKTGERSFLTYLLNPLIKRVAASMKEE